MTIDEALAWLDGLDPRLDINIRRTNETPGPQEGRNIRGEQFGMDRWVVTISRPEPVTLANGLLDVVSVVVAWADGETVVSAIEQVREKMGAGK